MTGFRGWLKPLSFRDFIQLYWLRGDRGRFATKFPLPKDVQKSRWHRGARKGQSPLQTEGLAEAGGRPLRKSQLGRTSLSKIAPMKVLTGLGRLRGYGSGVAGGGGHTANVWGRPGAEGTKRADETVDEFVARRGGAQQFAEGDFRPEVQHRNLRKQLVNAGPGRYFVEFGKRTKGGQLRQMITQFPVPTYHGKGGAPRDWSEALRNLLQGYDVEKGKHRFINLDAVKTVRPLDTPATEAPAGEIADTPQGTEYKPWAGSHPTIPAGAREYTSNPTRWYPTGHGPEDVPAPPMKEMRGAAGLGRFKTWVNRGGGEGGPTPHIPFAHQNFEERTPGGAPEQMIRQLTGQRPGTFQPVGGLGSILRNIPGLAHGVTPDSYGQAQTWRQKPALPRWARTSTPASTMSPASKPITYSDGQDPEATSPGAGAPPPRAAGPKPLPPITNVRRLLNGLLGHPPDAGKGQTMFAAGQPRPLGFTPKSKKNPNLTRTEPETIQPAPGTDLRGYKGGPSALAGAEPPPRPQSTLDDFLKVIRQTTPRPPARSPQHANDLATHGMTGAVSPQRLPSVIEGARERGIDPVVMPGPLRPAFPPGRNQVAVPDNAPTPPDDLDLSGLGLGFAAGDLGGSGAMDPRFPLQEQPREKEGGQAAILAELEQILAGKPNGDAILTSIADAFRGRRTPEDVAQGGHGQLPPDIGQPRSFIGPQPGRTMNRLARTKGRIEAVLPSPNREVPVEIGDPSEVEPPAAGPRDLTYAPDAGREVPVQTVREIRRSEIPTAEGVMPGKHGNILGALARSDMGKLLGSGMQAVPREGVNQFLGPVDEWVKQHRQGAAADIPGQSRAMDRRTMSRPAGRLSQMGDYLRAVEDAGAQMDKDFRDPTASTNMKALQPSEAKEWFKDQDALAAKQPLLPQRELERRTSVAEGERVRRLNETDLPGRQNVPRRFENGDEMMGAMAGEMDFAGLMKPGGGLGAPKVMRQKKLTGPAMKKANVREVVNPRAKPAGGARGQGAQIPNLPPMPQTPQKAAGSPTARPNGPAGPTGRAATPNAGNRASQPPSDRSRLTGGGIGGALGAGLGTLALGPLGTMLGGALGAGLGARAGGMGTMRGIGRGARSAVRGLNTAAEGVRAGGRLARSLPSLPGRLARGGGRLLGRLGGAALGTVGQGLRATASEAAKAPGIAGLLSALRSGRQGVGRGLAALKEGFNSFSAGASDPMSATSHKNPILRRRNRLA